MAPVAQHDLEFGIGRGSGRRPTVRRDRDTHAGWRGRALRSRPRAPARSTDAGPPHRACRRCPSQSPAPDLGAACANGPIAPRNMWMVSKGTLALRMALDVELSAVGIRHLEEAQARFVLGNDRLFRCKAMQAPPECLAGRKQHQPGGKQRRRCISDEAWARRDDRQDGEGKPDRQQESSTCPPCRAGRATPVRPGGCRRCCLRCWRVAPGRHGYLAAQCRSARPSVPRGNEKPMMNEAGRTTTATTKAITHSMGLLAAHAPRSPRSFPAEGQGRFAK